MDVDDDWLCEAKPILCDRKAFFCNAFPSWWTGFVSQSHSIVKNTLLHPNKVLKKMSYLSHCQVGRGGLATTVFKSIYGRAPLATKKGGSHSVSVATEELATTVNDSVNRTCLGLRPSLFGPRFMGCDGQSFCVLR